MANRINGRGVAHMFVEAAFHETADSLVAELSGGRYVAAGPGALSFSRNCLSACNISATRLS
jgi:hypothetical protein